MRSYKTEGVILKRTNFGEADRIIIVFTKKHGKIKVLAKGVRRITSRRGPNIELFNHVVLFLHKGQAFDIVTEAQVVNTFPKIREKLELIGLAYYVCELVDGLCAENQPHPRVFELLIAALGHLGGGRMDSPEVKGIIHRFETTLLSELGFLPLDRSETIDTTSYIEQLLERRLKTRRLLAKLT